jgi:hypothetical protein
MSTHSRGGAKVHSDSWHWFLKALVKFVLFGVPAVAALVFWKRRGVQSRVLYRISMINSVGYLVWLPACIGVVFLGSSLVYRDFFIYRWIDDLSIPQDLYIFLPFLLFVGSLFMCLLCRMAEKGERGFVVLVNGLMLILWASNLVAPN